MAQKPLGIRRWLTIPHYKIVFLLLFLSGTAYSCTNKKTETELVVTQNQQPSTTLFGKKLSDFIESKYNSAGVDFFVAPNLAKQINAKTDAFVDLGTQMMEGINVRIATFRIADSKKTSAIDNKQNRYLFVEKKGNNGFEISDTLRVNKGNDFAVNLLLENNRKGIAVGNFNQNSDFFEIKELYEISKDGKKKKLDLETTVLDCPAPTDYNSDEDSGNYQFGTKNGQKYSRFWKENSSKNQSQEGSYILDEATISLKDKTLKVLVFEKNNNKTENAQHFDLKIEISEQSKTDFKTKSNSNIVQSLDGNCTADGFTNVVSKDNFFTIEQTFCKGALYVSAYTTFKITGNDVLLHKYSETYTDRNDPDKIMKDRIWSSKEFGQIKFENFDHKTSIKR